MTIHYQGLSETFDIPGWCCVYGEGIVTGTENMEPSRKIDALEPAPSTEAEAADRPETNPLARIAGSYADDPNWAEFMQALEDSRCKLDAD